MKIGAFEIIKDFFISALIVVCLCMIISVIFYDKVSLGKVIPESENHALSEEMQQELEESNLEDAEEVIINYYIDAADLKKYEKTNEYIKGKSNPFAVQDISDTDNSNTDNANNSSSTGNNSSSENFYEDDGTK